MSIKMKKEDGKSKENKYTLSLSKSELEYLNSAISSTPTLDSSYQEDLDKDKIRRQHTREEKRKDFFNNLNIEVTDFFLLMSKIIILVYVAGLIAVTYFNLSFNLEKIEFLAYTIVSIGIGVLIDKAMIQKQ